MAKIKNNPIPELWTQELLDVFKQQIKMSTRSYGVRLLRAAAKGEDWTKIKREEDIHDRYTDDATDALAHQLDAAILNSLRNRSKP